tara:strand:+ start:143 stop:301 length:159 start_codon:yes stop_codon:yes gene_type:complete
MKFRNNWNNPNKQWDKVMIRLRISSLDIFNLEVDISRNFYLLTILNFTFKNR